MRLCDTHIEEYLDAGKLVITPRPPQSAISGVSIDIRLGNEFRVFSEHTTPYIDLSGPKNEVAASLDKVMSDVIVIDDDQAFFLHPGELALAVTYEDVTLPSDIVFCLRTFLTLSYSELYFLAFRKSFETSA